MKKLSSTLIVPSAIILAGALLFAVYHFANGYLAMNKTNAEPAPVATCRQHGVEHAVTIKDDKMNPGHIQAHLCDTLTITNTDDKAREIAFGPHDRHIPYDGVAEKELAKGQSLTLTLNQPGTYHFHDHLEDAVAGDFTVTNQ